MNRGRDGKRALIVGGSIGGLFAGLLLLRRGWDVEIFERSEELLAGRGAGIVTHPEFAHVVAAAGVAPDETLGVEVRRRRAFERSGQMVAEHECCQTLTSWDRLHSLLRSRFPAERYQIGRQLQRFEQGEGVTAHFSDGASVSGDLLVGADGIRSTVRSQLFPDVLPRYAGYVAWRGLVAEAELSRRVLSEVFGYFSFCLPPGEQMLGYPVAGPADDLRPGRRSYNFVWYRPAAEQDELRRLLTDAAGRTHGLSIPPPLIRPQIVQEMRLAADMLLAPQFREIVHKTHQPLLQPIYDLESPRMASGRVVLVGDAAFVARPHVGAGVAKAALDAMALADALASEGTVESGLRRFEQERLPVGRKIVTRARELGAYMQAQLRTPEERQLAERHRSPEAVMREIAVLDFLRS